jgi:hypothetical protein
LPAIGAILRFATTVHSSNFNIQTIGDILIIAGAIGFVVSLFFWSSWGGFGGGGGYSRRTVYGGRAYHDPGAGRIYGDGVRGGHTVVEEEEHHY